MRSRRTRAMAWRVAPRRRCAPEATVSDSVISLARARRPLESPLSSGTALAGALLAVAMLPGSALATDFNVNSDASLRAAITSAGNGDRIIFSSNITLTADLPAVQTNVTIIGNNNSCRVITNSAACSSALGQRARRRRWPSPSRSRI